jgi:hypothetical protein
MHLKKLKASLEKIIKEEGYSWVRIEALREGFFPEKIKEIEYSNEERAIKDGLYVVREILQAFQEIGLDFSGTPAEAGHGKGHLIRNYLNSLRLFSKMMGRPRHIFIGLVAGILHDLGYLMIDSCWERKRAIGHAEIGALMLLDAMQNLPLKDGLGKVARIAIAYAVAAHSHYLDEKRFIGEDGKIRIRKPYPDLDEVGCPIFAVWFPRWVDRLDLNGPTFVARHFLTLENHFDRGESRSRTEIALAEYFKPILRSPEEIKKEGGKKTMLEHLYQFHQSQTNNSPYGRYDFGRMVILRDETKRFMTPIIEAVRHPVDLTQSEEENILRAWFLFLTSNIEPTEKGRKAAQKLGEIFKELPKDSRQAWLNGFREVMRQYLYWANSVLGFFEKESLFTEGIFRFWNDFSPVTSNVKAIIQPSLEWTNLLLLS